MKKGEMTLYILGIFHITSSRIEKTFRDNKFDKVLSEGINSDAKAYSVKNLLREPFFLLRLLHIPNS